MAVERGATFIHLAGCVADAKRLRLSDNEQRDIENAIMANPHVGSVMAGTGGVRKFRVARSGGGTSGGYRVCYAVILDDTITLVSIYAKNEQANVSQADRADMKRLVDRLRGQLR